MPFNITGEYWLDSYGSILAYADGNIGDFNHEGYAMQHAQSSYLSELGIDSEFGEFDELEDEVVKEILDQNPDWVDEYQNEGSNYIINKYNEENKLEGLYSIASGIGDARKYAINVWGWMTVRGNYVECKDINRDTLKAISRGIDDIIDTEGLSYNYENDEDDDDNYDENGELMDVEDSTIIHVSAYNKGKSFSYSLRQLKNQKINKDELTDKIEMLNKNARVEVDKLDRQNLNPTYKHFGDSYKNLNKNLIKEGNLLNNSKMNQRKELTEFLANLSKGDFANAQTSLSLAIEGKIKERMAAIMKEEKTKPTLTK